MRLSRYFIIAVTCLVLTACSATETPEGFTDLSAKEAHDILSGKNGVHVLDIRTRGEFASGHIKGAQNLNFYSSNFKGKLAGLDREKTWLVYCRTGRRSGATMPILQVLGFKSVLHLKHGISAWVDAGYPVVK